MVGGEEMAARFLDNLARSTTACSQPGPFFYAIHKNRIERLPLRNQLPHSVTARSEREVPISGTRRSACSCARFGGMGDSRCPGWVAPVGCGVRLRA